MRNWGDYCRMPRWDRKAISSHAEQHHLLHQAILRIPPPLRIVLVLHDMEELTTEQVAQVLSLQQGTVRIRLHRARLSVRKEMSQTPAGSS